MRVAVTRPSEDADGLVRRLEEAGFDAILLPVLRREWIVGALDGIRGDHDLLLLTSPAAAAACGPLRGRAPAVVGCVGPATAAVAAQVLGVLPLVPADHEGAALVAHLAGQVGDLRGRRVLWVRGQHVTAATRQALQDAGARVTDVVAYQTVRDPSLARSRLAEGPAPDLVTLTSPRIARAWADVGHGAAPCVCIGPSTAKAAEAVGLDVIAVASPHDLEGLVAACAAWARGR